MVGRRWWDYGPDAPTGGKREALKTLSAARLFGRTDRLWSIGVKINRVSSVEIERVRLGVPD